MSINGRYLSFLDNDLRQDKEIIKIAVKQDLQVLREIGEKNIDKELLFSVETELEMNKFLYPIEYDMLVAYKREDKLTQELNKLGSNKKSIKNKI